jgi:hypothetical protein
MRQMNPFGIGDESFFVHDHFIQLVPLRKFVQKARNLIQFHVVLMKS